MRRGLAADNSRAMTPTPRTFRRGLLVAALLAPALARAQTAPWMQSGLSPDRRTALLLGAMTLDEKFQQLVGAPGVVAEIPSCYGARHVPGIARLRIPTFRITNGPGRRRPERLRAGDDAESPARRDDEHRLGRRRPRCRRRWRSPRRSTARWRRSSATSSAWRRGTAGCTCSKGPGSTSRACRRAGATSSTSARIRSSPGRWRVAEIRAMQKHGVIAMAKHFIANDHETNRTTENVIVADRVLHELYLLPFEMAVRTASVASVMCSYNRVNGPYSCENATSAHRRPARPVGVRRLRAVRLLRRRSDGAARSCAGMDHEMPGRRARPARRRGIGRRSSRRRSSKREITHGDDRHRAGAAVSADVPARDLRPAGEATTPMDVARNAAIAREIGEQAAVLLKNDRALLPLDAQSHEVGRADRPGRVRDEGGRGLLRRKLGRDPVRDRHAARRHAAGARAAEVAGDRDAHRRRRRSRNLADAVAAARGADVVIVLAGTIAEEGRDRDEHRAGEWAGLDHRGGRRGEPAHRRRPEGQRVVAHPMARTRCRRCSRRGSPGRRTARSSRGCCSGSRRRRGSCR